MNELNQMKKAVSEAQQTLKAADSVAGTMARLLIGRLRFVPGWILCNLKRELRDFNMTTYQWRK